VDAEKRDENPSQAQNAAIVLCLVCEVTTGLFSAVS
jgi:hypothetical protein